MAEQKKRWRPSLTAYRELEKQLAYANEQCLNLRNTRISADESEKLKERIKELESENTTLAKSNDWADKELKNIRSHNKRIENENKTLKEDMEVLKSRGFWARVFNR